MMDLIFCLVALIGLPLHIYDVVGGRRLVQLGSAGTNPVVDRLLRRGEIYVWLMKINEAIVLPALLYLLIPIGTAVIVMGMFVSLFVWISVSNFQKIDKLEAPEDEPTGI